MQIPKPNNEYDLTDRICANDGKAWNYRHVSPLSIHFESDIHELPSYNQPSPKHRNPEARGVWCAKAAGICGTGWRFQAPGVSDGWGRRRASCPEPEER